MAEKSPGTMIGIITAIAIGALVAWAGSDGSAMVGSVSVFALCGFLAYLINWMVFIPSNAAKTEKYFDLTGSLTYIAITIAAVVLSGDLDARAFLAAGAVTIWAARLGTFLFRRILKSGKDDRFDELKASSLRFLMTWTLQGAWILLTAAAALAIITSTNRQQLDWMAYLGVVMWLVGFTIEVVADRQKSAFKDNPGNEGRFITTGLWAWSRHPNYFGEITLWTGIAIMAVPILSGWRWVVLISPIFVTLLLTKISGIPILERRADARWGDEAAYRKYRDSTPVLVPKPPNR